MTRNRQVLLGALIVILAAAYYLGGRNAPVQPRAAVEAISSPGDVLAAAFRDHRSHIQVQGAGQVSRVLPDDNDGSRHQRFIVRLASGQTLLVAHNIDLAARVDDLKAGDTVEFNGEYDWDSRGGVIHWTHHDPQGRHASGWLRHDGRSFQ